MSDIVQQLRHTYHLDSVQHEHPIRRAVDEIERLRATVAAAGRALADAQRQIAAIVAAPGAPTPITLPLEIKLAQGARFAIPTEITFGSETDVTVLKPGPKLEQLAQHEEADRVTAMLDASLYAVDPSGAARRVAALLPNNPETEIEQLIDERDERDSAIDKILDVVLGKDRPEWSSAYGLDDAVRDVREQFELRAISDPRRGGVDPEAAAAACRTLIGLRYTWSGGEQWKPPLGTVDSRRHAPSLAAAFDYADMRRFQSLLIRRTSDLADARFAMEETATAIEGVLRVADRKTVEFDALRHVLAGLRARLLDSTEEPQPARSAVEAVLDAVPGLQALAEAQEPPKGGK